MAHISGGGGGDVSFSVGSDKEHADTTSSSLASLSVQNHRNEKELRETSRIISLSCYFSIILVLFSVTLAVVVFIVSTSISEDKRVFVSTVIGAGTLGVLAILVLSKNHPKTLLVLIPVATFIAGALTGFSIFSV